MPHHASKLPACANCYYAFPAGEPDEFCPRCGQQNHAASLGFGHVAEEFLEGVFHFDGKVFRTAKLLLFKPGQLTLRFLQGHRVPYVPPIRLYVFISFVFFALLSLLKGHDHDDKRRLGDLVARTPAAAAKPAPDTGFRISLFNTNFTAEELARFPEDLTDARVDSVIRSKGKQPSALRRQGVRALVRWRDASKEEIMHKLLQGTSVVVFLLMPLAALLLAAAYFRRPLSYTSHLVFTVHLHCFLFVFVGVLLLLTKARPPLAVVGTLGVVPAAYFLVALRTFYAQSWVKTIFKGLLLGGAYAFTLWLAVLLVFVGGLLYS